MDRKVYLDHLRGFATFAIVVLHVAASGWYAADVSGVSWQIMNIYDGIMRWGVPAFMMISGALFLSREIPVKKIYTKYILRLVAAYVFWNLFYILTLEDTFQKGPVRSFGEHYIEMITGHYHMWFVVALIMMYICIPIFKKIVSDKRLTGWCLGILFVLFFLIPSVFRILTDLVLPGGEAGAGPESIFSLRRILRKVTETAAYSFYYILGFVLDRAELKKKARVIIYILGAAGLAATILLSLAASLKAGHGVESFYGNFNVHVLCTAVGVHTWFKYHAFNNERRNRLAVTLSTLGFGVYLVHPFFIEKLREICGLQPLSFSAVVSVPVISVIVFAAALGASVLLNRIPFVKKYLV